MLGNYYDLEQIVIKSLFNRILFYVKLIEWYSTLYICFSICRKGPIKFFLNVKSFKI